MFLFFHFFHVYYETQTWGRGLIYLELNVHGFGPLSELAPFEDRFFLVTPISLKAHATICTVEGGVEGELRVIF